MAVGLIGASNFLELALAAAISLLRGTLKTRSRSFATHASSRRSHPCWRRWASRRGNCCARRNRLMPSSVLPMRVWAMPACSMPCSHVLDILPLPQRGPFAKEDGERVIDERGARVQRRK